jgi:hypothetical protein
MFSEHLYNPKHFLDYDNWSKFLHAIKGTLRAIQSNPENHSQTRAIIQLNRFLGNLEKSRNQLKQIEWAIERRLPEPKKHQFDELVAKFNDSVEFALGELTKIKLASK